VLQHVKNGALRALAVTTGKRLAYLPDLPTIAESGFPGYEINSWQGVFAPAGTPQDVILKINGEIVRMLRAPDVRERMSHEGADPVGSTPEEFSKRVASELVKWSKLIKDIGMATAN
jgi:tripartite-type tricarboxylate transporter receptor subunit TctC